MSNLIKKFTLLIDEKSLKLILFFQKISIFICLLATFLLEIYSKYYISVILYQSAIILFKTGLMIAIFPTFFSVIINKWKNDQNI